MAQLVKNPPAVWETWVEKRPWRSAWQPIPVFLPGESHGRRSLAGYSPWGHKESDKTEQLSVHARVRTCTHTHTHTHSSILSWRIPWTV